jgi:hypothetical protein
MILRLTLRAFYPRRSFDAKVTGYRLVSQNPHSQDVVAVPLVVSLRTLPACRPESFICVQ